MIVRDLINELEKLSQDLPVITNCCEIKTVKEENSLYYLDNAIKDNYMTGPVVVLE